MLLDASSEELEEVELSLSLELVTSLLTTSLLVCSMLLSISLLITSDETPSLELTVELVSVVVESELVTVDDVEEVLLVDVVEELPFEEELDDEDGLLLEEGLLDEVVELLLGDQPILFAYQSFFSIPFCSI